MLLHALMKVWDPNISPDTMRTIARIVFFSSIVGWPLTAFTVASSEPPFTLGLSWFAVILESANAFVITKVNKEVSEG